MSKQRKSDVPDVESELPAAPQLPGSKAKAAENQEASAPPVWKKHAFRAVIALLAIAAVFEFWAQSQFRKHLRICQDVLDRNEGKLERVTYDQLKDQFNSTPSYSEGIHQFAKNGIYSWSWQGIRRYKLPLYVDPASQSILDVESEPMSDR